MVDAAGFESTRDLLEELLVGAPFSQEDLDRVVSRFPEEDQYLEYKDGKITTEKSEKQLKQEILFHVTGFAGAVGGVLVVGVSEERPREVTGAKAPGESPLGAGAGG